jgi:hypothetical protein
LESTRTEEKNLLRCACFINSVRRDVLKRMNVK